MKIEQRLWTTAQGWEILSPQQFPAAPQLVLAFGDRVLVEDEQYLSDLRTFYPNSPILLGSTGGEILGRRVRDHSLAVSALYFEKTTLVFAETEIRDFGDSFAAGERLAAALPPTDLVHVLVFSDGTHMNGSELTRSLNAAFPPSVTVTGGFMGDGINFKQTAVGLNARAQEGKVIAVGLYGSALSVGYGSFGGWDAFGLDRTITKSKGAVLYELDGKPALELYKNYLGERAAGLPVTALYFPLRLRLGAGADASEVIRTVFDVNEADQSVTAFGDMPEGTQVTLMKANFGRLIDGAVSAGTMSLEKMGELKPEFALLVSCVGRKMVLKDQTEEEIEAVSNLFGEHTPIAGFYSYGEICPFGKENTQCQFHNQTMTITVFREV